MSASLPTLVLPKDGNLRHSHQRSGCGCCQHCRCTGSCIDKSNALQSNLNTPLGSPSASPRAASPLPLPSPNRGQNGGTKDNYYSVLERTPHPGDAIAFSRKLNLKQKVEHRIDKKDVLRYMSSKSPSQNSLVVDGTGISLADKNQEEYEAAYRFRARESSKGSRSDVKESKQSLSNDEDQATHSSRKPHRSEHFRDQHKDRIVSERPEMLVSKDEEARPKMKSETSVQSEADSRAVITNDDCIGAKGDIIRHRSHGHRKKNSEVSKIQRDHQDCTSSNEKHIGQDASDIAESKDAPTNDQSVTPQRDYLKSPSQDQRRIRTKRDILKEIKHLVKEAAMAPSSTSNKTADAICSSTVALTGIQQAIDTIDQDNESQSKSFKVMKRLSVHLSTEHASTLLFYDESRRNENGRPLVAFRLQDPECSLEKKGGAGYIFKKNDYDWFHESYSKGIKVKGKVTLAVGVKGPNLYEINVRRRKVDKFVIDSLEDAFSTKPNGGNHDDHRHLYFETPDKTAMKWELIEDDRLMRLYGRGEKDHGIIYAEAKMNHPKHKNKEATLVFYDPNDTAQNHSKDYIEADDLDYAFLCASWWCARQTFDESRLVAAHDEVQFIENIEDAFEIDLLALA